MNKVWDKLPPDLKENPFFHFSEKTNYVPAWDRIKLAHVMPAMEYAIALAQENIRKITDNPARPTFRNTVEALEQSDELLNYFFGILFDMDPGTGAAEKKYDDLVNDVIEKNAAALGDLFLNKKLYRRLQAVGRDPSYKTLGEEQKRLFRTYRQSFLDEGVNIAAHKKKLVQKLTERIADLAFKCQNNMKMAERAYTMTVGNKEKLRGLPKIIVADAARRAREEGKPGKWVFGIAKDTYVPFMQSCEDRRLREKMWHAYHTQGTSGRYDNRATVLKLARLEQQQARLLGFPNYATLALRDNMSGKPERVAKFLLGLRDAALPAAKHELKVLKEYARNRNGITLEPWDVEFYKERLKKDVLGFDEEELRPYFELENTIKGVFRHYEKFFNIKFRETDKYPVFHPDVRAVEVYKKDTNKFLGIVFMDLYTRKGKPAGTAWESAVLGQGLFEGKIRRPVDMIVTKFVKGEPTLLRPYDVEVLFHELGHATNNLLSRCKYQNLSGTNVEGDFVEFCSQFQENYAVEPSVLADIAVHHKTGERLPEELCGKIKESRKFMAGSEILRGARKGWLDLAWYRANTDRITSTKAFEEAVLAPWRLLPHYDSQFLPRYSHISGGGYEANFSSYQWSQVREADAFARFSVKGLYNRALCDAYRKIPERGGSVHASRLFHDFRGRAPQEKYFLARAGLLGDHFNYEAGLKPANSAPAAAQNRPALAMAVS
jgi:peptidyl-dipeptidase Dcp